MVGKVYLVGAGPGDYKLMTLKGWECLKQADVLVYDRLVNSVFLNAVRENCELIYVGKKSNNHTLPQSEINALLVKKAKEGKCVVRLKGGDPYVFGRGGEEGEAMVAHGIDFEVVPGISSAIGGLAYAGIPITHRDCASSFHVITAHLKNERKELDWDTLAKLDGTLVFLMGANSLNEISKGLIKAGKSTGTPVALVHRASTPKQYVEITTLEEMVEAYAESPVLIVIGDVVNLHEKLNFFEKKPLFGKNVMVTRARKQSMTLVDRLLELGANVIEVPTIEIVPLPSKEELGVEINQLALYQYIVFTSVNTVDIFFSKLDEMRYDARSLAGVQVVAIGKQTAKALSMKGIKADIVPELATLEGLVTRLTPLVKQTDRILIPKAKKTRPVLKEQLPASITEVVLYETRMDTIQKGKIVDYFNQELVDYLTFSSSSTVENFIQLIGADYQDLVGRVKIISLGPITTQTIEKAGLTVYKEAREPLIDAMVELLKEG
jgi:uroporphyrinogen III methyltransferase/synthase